MSESDDDSSESDSRFSSTFNTSDSISIVDTAKPTIGADENRRVFWSKVLMCLVLASSAALVAWGTYEMTTNDEEESFQSDFRGIAAEIIAVVEQKEESIKDVMDEFTVMLTSSVKATGQEWPYVTIPDFERRAAASMEATIGYLMEYIVEAPGGSLEALEAWNNFTNDNDWYYESCEVAGVEPVPFPELLTVPDPNVLGKQYPVLPNLTEELIPPVVLSKRQSSPPFHDSFRYKESFNTIQYRRLTYMKETHRTSRGRIFNFDRYIESQTVTDPTNFYMVPIFDNFSDEKQVVGFITLLLRWQDHFANVLHDSAIGIRVVLENTAGQNHTYQIDGNKASYLGDEALYDKKYEDIGVKAGVNVDLEDYENGDLDPNNCFYVMTIYPSDELREQYDTNKPLLFTLGVLGVFIFTSLVFLLYDRLVQRRQDTVLASAEKTDAIVSSLFPSQFRDRLLEDEKSNVGVFSVENSKKRLRKFMDGVTGEDNVVAGLSLGKPVADLFPDATIMFADIVGFTAWSSVREPSQVFTLLESIYVKFDELAMKRKVFKVETVGDAYVAVCGVPEQRRDHATVMARYAKECLYYLPRIVMELERYLGPGTGDLTMRFGLHSGQVTAGVLRGEKARFQLFGDTVNTAARMESSGLPGRVHVSEQTARLLIESGKSTWITKREGTVEAKGKGHMQTYWLKAGSGSRAPSLVERSENTGDVENRFELATSSKNTNQTARLVDWNVEVLLNMLKQIAASRSNTVKESAPFRDLHKKFTESLPWDEVTDIIELPSFDAAICENSLDTDVLLHENVESELYDFVSRIAAGYRNNPFHNFAHASHVAMSVQKLLSRIVAPDVDVSDETKKGYTDKQLQREYKRKLHEATFGITSDPLTQFAVVLSALAHDIEHPGVPNNQVAKEQIELSQKYGNKSIAEQNSVDVAWKILMSNDFDNLRKCIYTSEEEMKRFRQILVNDIMATDIFQPDMKALRQRRWDAAFHPEASADTTRNEESQIGINRKATIVIEHILQASDVAHTMQHWHVYLKWNERLFQEMYLAYLNGRAEKNPADGWYKGELWFYDNYVIPLAKKLDDCGVFGVSSSEYLAWAEQNRKEWEQKGEGIVQNMLEKFTVASTPIAEGEIGE